MVSQPVISNWMVVWVMWNWLRRVLLMPSRMQPQSDMGMSATVTWLARAWELEPRDQTCNPSKASDVHDLHVWSLGSSSHALASHVTVADMPMSDCGCILEGINKTLRSKFHITHTTIQFEITGCETTHGCSAPPELEAVGAHDHHHHHGHSHTH